MTNFQLLMLSPNLLKSQSCFMVGVGVEGDWEVNFQLSDAESKFAKI